MPCPRPVSRWWGALGTDEFRDEKATIFGCFLGELRESYILALWHQLDSNTSTTNRAFQHWDTNLGDTWYIVALGARPGAQDIGNKYQQIVHLSVGHQLGLGAQDKLEANPPPTNRTI